MVFSSILLVEYWDLRRRKRMEQLNKLLRGWRQAQVFVFCGLGGTFDRLNVWTSNENNCPEGVRMF